MNVILIPEVRVYFRTLIVILFEKGYFSFKDSAKKYVDELLDDILLNLHEKQHKPAPEYFSTFGNDMEYASFRKNKHTTWYVFFETYEVNESVFYLVRYIANNHTVAQYL